MEKSTVKDLSYMAMYVALALVLDYVSQMIPFLNMFNGGSVNLGVIPVFIAAYQLGGVKGITVGALWWLVGCLFGLNNWYLNPMQYMLDYILPDLVIGAACFMPKLGKISNVFTGVTVVGILRYVFTVLSGVYFWFPDGEVAGSAGAWIYSLSYNSLYNLGTLIVAIILVPMAIKLLQKTNTKFVAIKE